MTRQRSIAWWGSFEFDLEQTRRWTLGPLDLWVLRRSFEWQLAWRVGDDPMESDIDVARQSDASELPEDGEFARYGFRSTSPTLNLEPQLADRPLVVGAEKPFYIPPGEEMRLYLGSPLWITLKVDSDTVLRSMPIFRPKDTWFGPSTLEGQLCYAGRTAARSNLNNLPRRPHRAITAVLIRNRATNVLSLEKILLPVPRLAVWAAEDGVVWTDSLTLERDEDGELVSLDTGEPPQEAHATRRLSGPRATLERGGLLRTFSSFFHKEGDPS